MQGKGLYAHEPAATLSEKHDALHDDHSGRAAPETREGISLTREVKTIYTNWLKEDSLRTNYAPVRLPGRPNKNQTNTGSGLTSSNGLGFWQAGGHIDGRCAQELPPPLLSRLSRWKGLSPRTGASMLLEPVLPRDRKGLSPPPLPSGLFMGESGLGAGEGAPPTGDAAPR